MLKRMGLIALLLMLCALVMNSIALIHVLRAPNLYEYMAPAPVESVVAQPNADVQLGDDEEPAALRQPAGTLSSLLLNIKENEAEVASVMPSYALWGYAPNVGVTGGESEQSTATCALWAVSEGYFSIYPKLMRYGRELTYDELQYAQDVVLLDEQLALQLFGTTDAVDLRVTIMGRDCRVAGVVRHQKTVGEPSEMGAYVPLRMVAKDALQLQTVTIAAPPSTGTASLQAVSELASGLIPGGTMQDSRRTKQLATLVPLWAVGALLAYLLGLGITRMFTIGGGWISDTRASLRTQYALRLVPKMLLRTVIWFCATGALFALVVLLASQLIKPVLLFPEWIPSVPVEPTEIQKTFWNLQWTNNTMITCRTPLTLMLTFYGTIANTGVVMGLLGMIIAFVNRIRSA